MSRSAKMYGSSTPKNVVLAALLGLFFGPFGLAYASLTAAGAMLLVTVVDVGLIFYIAAHVASLPEGTTPTPAAAAILLLCIVGAWAICPCCAILAAIIGHNHNEKIRAFEKFQ